jgi:hypothetical protein
MSTYDFITDNIRFSYSSTSTFNNCAYSFKLTYIDNMCPRQNNFFGEYGNLIHSCFENYFNEKIESYETSQYYRDNYNLVVKTPPPSIPSNLEEKYKQSGQDFFDSFSFDKENYEVMLVEDKIDFDLDGVLIVAKPDLVLMNKKTGDFILYDYKTATPYWEDKKTGKEKSDAKKLAGYYQQMFIYTYALRNYRITPIDEIVLWFIRLNKKVSIPWSLEKEEKAIASLIETIEKIKKEELFIYNNSNLYFCDNLCGVRAFCEYR